MSRLRGNRRTKETWNIDEATSDNHIKQRPSRANLDKFYKEFFKVYLTEFEKICELINEENDFSTRNIKNDQQIRGMPRGFNEIIILNF